MGQNENVEHDEIVYYHLSWDIKADEIDANNVEEFLLTESARHLTEEEKEKYFARQKELYCVLRKTFPHKENTIFPNQSTAVLAYILDDDETINMKTDQLKKALDELVSGKHFVYCLTLVQTEFEAIPKIASSQYLLSYNNRRSEMFWSKDVCPDGEPKKQKQKDENVAARTDSTKKKNKYVKGFLDYADDPNT